ncbi:MAG TPA: hypothetical protein ENJ95_07775 [Bacteroidetes bacterium]|nr:hypothetical protein [Bacteroidota bacterium]
MKKFLFSLSAIIVFSNTMLAQNLNDVLRYSLLEVGGTARSVGVGGAIGALGADFSVLSTNPAGAAAFRRSEFTFTPTFERATADGLLAGDGNFLREDSKSNFNLNNIGIIFSGRPLDSKWRTAVFGIGINRMANFHQNIFYEGSTFGSITDRWWELAGTLPEGQLDQFEAAPALAAEALYDYDPQLGYLTDFLDADEQPGSFLVDKSQRIERKGSINELAFTYAGNYDEKLMIGATLGVPILKYEETKTYIETDESDRVPFFESLEFKESLKTTGGGINLKLGMIYRLSQMVRFGLAIHTPTSFGLEDNFSTSTKYEFDLGQGGETREGNSPESNFEYRIRTPWRLIGSGGVIINKKGFLSAEFEFVDYTSSRFNFNSTDNQGDLDYEQELNDQIANELGSTVNMRLGGEYALDQFRLRAGFTLTPSPYETGGDTNTTFSVGAGYRGQEFFIDLAYKRLSNQSNYKPYLLSTGLQNLEQSVSIDEQRDRFMVTLGFKL